MPPLTLFLGIPRDGPLRVTESYDLAPDYALFQSTSFRADRLHGSKSLAVTRAVAVTVTGAGAGAGVDDVARAVARAVSVAVASAVAVSGA